jgi:citrate lyase subunit beta/citryl-CoA lyase
LGMTVILDFVAPLFVPADRPERFQKAAASGADAVIIDLEDGVPSGAKAAARSALRTDFTALPILVRINAAGTKWHEDDLRAVAELPLVGIVVPKAELREELRAICSGTGTAYQHPVVALIETARGLAEARQIAALPGVERLAFGSVDFCADLGCAHTRDALLAARSELVVASRLAGKLAPIDGVTTSIKDPELVLADARYARELGFAGKLCIHPGQVAAILTGFQPDATEIAWARRVLTSSHGAVTVDGAMVDEPVRARARHILARAPVAAGGI